MTKYVCVHRCNIKPECKLVMTHDENCSFLDLDNLIDVAVVRPIDNKPLELYNLNFHSFAVVSRYRDPQLHDKT